MSQTAEPSLLEYARFYGLATDHRAIDPLKDLIATEPLLRYDEPSELFQIDAISCSPMPERLTVGKEAANLLSSIRSFQGDLPQFDEELLPDVHRLRNLKLEEPLLRTDHEFDMHNLFTQIVPDLENEVAHLPLERIDDELDEGLEWPKSCYELSKLHNVNSVSEKLVIHKDTITFLQSTMNVSEEIWEPIDIWYHSGKYKRSNALDPITPPLLPMSPQLLPFVPSSETARLELLSEHTSPICNKLFELEKQIMYRDTVLKDLALSEADYHNCDPVLLNSEDLENLYSPLKGIREPPSSPPIQRFRAEDYKVDGPLTPPRSEQTYIRRTKNVPFRESLLEVIDELPPLAKTPEDISSEDLDALFTETIQPIADKVNQRIEQERLQEADTTCRVGVPIMDFSRPIAPWNIHNHPNSENKESRFYTFLSDIRTEHLNNHFWLMSSKAERSLHWAPFLPELGIVAIQESIEEDESLLSMLTQPSCIDINTLIWKPDGLRILDDNESDDDEIEFGNHLTTEDMGSLLRKRKLELQSRQSTDNGVAKHRKAGGDYDLGNTATVSVVPNTESEILIASDWDKESLLEGGFSTLNALNNFMDLRMNERKKRKLTDSAYFLKNVQKKDEGEVQEEVDLLMPGTKSLEKRAIIPNPLPEIIVPSEPRPFIVPAVTHRKIIRRVRELYPTAELIERYYDIHTNLSRPKTRCTEPVVSCGDSDMADEADILISPGTGILWTTLQKLKQRSLPGQTIRSPIRERITSVSQRCERLFILLSEGHGDDQSESVAALAAVSMDVHDCEAIAGLAGFCSALQTNVQVIFVGGGDKELAHWIVSLMIKHCDARPEVRLLQEETLWEIFLRQAGMNAFGAQVVLAELKAPEPMDVEGAALKNEFNLTAFVNMSLEERVRRFEHMFGGTRLLHRISNVMDAHW